MMEWYCYVCGGKIGDAFALLSLSRETDRVFLVHDDCVERTGQDPIVVGVTVRNRP